MRVTAADLLMGGWQRTWKWHKARWFCVGKSGKLLTATNLSFHEAVKLYKQGVRG